MDYLLSQRGQSLLNRIGLFGVREDALNGDLTVTELRREMGKAFQRVSSTGLLTYLDKMKRELFLDRWDAALASPR